MGRQKRYKQSEEGGANWLTTFNDLVTLLMVFFVLIFSMGSGESDKFEEMKNAVMRGLGLLEAEKRASDGLVRQPDGEIDTRKISSEEKQIEEIPDKLRDYISDLESAMPWIDATITESGVTLTLEGRVAFDPGTARINRRIVPALEGLGRLINKIPNDIRVEGHSDNIPIHTSRFPSNWDLSIARAVNVTRYLIEHAGVSPLRLSAVGYGDSRPRFPNDTAEHRAKNRRVDIVLLKGETG